MLDFQLNLASFPVPSGKVENHGHREGTTTPAREMPKLEMEGLVSRMFQERDTPAKFGMERKYNNQRNKTLRVSNGYVISSYVGVRMCVHLGIPETLHYGAEQGHTEVWIHDVKRRVLH